MKPTDYKGKTVTHIPTNYTFKVTGGKVEQGQVFLKDSIGELYPLHDCQLCEINQLDFDVRKLKQVKTHKELDKFFVSRGQDRFLEAWASLEDEPAVAAVIAILYCDNWEDFCLVINGYGVDEKQLISSENQPILSRIKEKGLDSLLSHWHSVEAAFVSFFYCKDWGDFCNITEKYGVSKERSPELNRAFRDRLSEKGLSGLVKTWYEESKANATT